MIVLFTIGDSIRWAHLEYLMNGRDRISIIKFYISAILLARISNVEILISYLNIIFYYRKYFDLHLKTQCILLKKLTLLWNDILVIYNDIQKFRRNKLFDSEKHIFL